MERGAAVLVLGLVILVSALAAVNLLYLNPTGRLATEQTVYPLEVPQQLPMPCAQGFAYFLTKEVTFSVYCCPEDLIGQNTCRRPQYVRLA